MCLVFLYNVLNYCFNFFITFFSNFLVPTFSYSTFLLLFLPILLLAHAFQKFAIFLLSFLLYVFLLIRFYATFYFCILVWKLACVFFLRRFGLNIRLFLSIFLLLPSLALFHIQLFAFLPILLLAHVFQKFAIFALRVLGYTFLCIFPLLYFGLKISSRHLFRFFFRFSCFLCPISLNKKMCFLPFQISFIF